MNDFYLLPETTETDRTCSPTSARLSQSHYDRFSKLLCCYILKIIAFTKLVSINLFSGLATLEASGGDSYLVFTLRWRIVNGFKLTLVCCRENKFISVVITEFSIILFENFCNHCELKSSSSCSNDNYNNLE